VLGAPDIALAVLAHGASARPIWRRRHMLRMRIAMLALAANSVGIR